MFNMEPKIISEKDIEEFGADTRVKELLNTKDWPFSIAKVRKVGDDIKTGHDPTDVVYYVLEGEGISVLNGKQYKVKKGDLIISPAGTKYKNLKGLTLLAISSPRFDVKKRVYVE
jgi:mannose-6-phosphate isomerase-like protein (cupin superfamily)